MGSCADPPKVWGRIFKAAHGCLEDIFKQLYRRKYPGKITDYSDRWVSSSSEDDGSDTSECIDTRLPLDIAIFVDNCSAHKAHLVKNICKAWHVPLIFNAVARPDLMGVELIWAAAKKVH